MIFLLTLFLAMAVLFLLLAFSAAIYLAANEILELKHPVFWTVVFLAVFIAISAVLSKTTF